MGQKNLIYKKRIMQETANNVADDTNASTKSPLNGALRGTRSPETLVRSRML